MATLYLSAGGRKTLIVCGKEEKVGYSVTHYNLLTGEIRCTARLDRGPYGMTIVLYDNRTCVALTYNSLIW